MAEGNHKRGRVVSYAQGEEFFLRRGQKHMQSGDYRNALVSYHKLLEMSPDTLRYLMDTAWLFGQLGYYEVSNRYLMRLLNLEGCEKDAVLHALGCNYYALCEYTCAEECLRLALVNSTDPEIREDAGALLSSLEGYQSDPEQPGFPPEYENLHNCYCAHIANDRCRKFPQLLALALSSGGDPYCAPLQYAVLLYFTGDWKNGLGFLEMMLESDPENYRAMAVYAVLLHRRGNRLGKAEPWLGKLKSIRSDFDDEVFCAAAALYEYGRYAEAAALLEGMDRTQVDGRLADQLLALSYYCDGQYTKAKCVWEDMARMMLWDGTARYYARLAAEAEAGKPRRKKLDMLADVPENEAAARMKLLSDLMIGDGERLREHWRQDAVREAVYWLAGQRNQSLAYAGCKILLEIRGKEDFGYVTDRILDRHRTELFRKQLAELLSARGYSKRIIFIGFGGLAAIWVPRLDSDQLAALSKSQRQAYAIAVQALYTRLEKDVTGELEALWVRMCRREKLVPKTMVRPEVWALGLEYAFLSSVAEIMDSPESMAARYDLNPKAARRVCDIIIRDGVLRENAAD